MRKRLFKLLGKKSFLLACMGISICYMALSGVTMNFSDGPPEFTRIIFHCSYFSLIPLGYGNWFPMIIAVSSIIVFILLLLEVKKYKYRVVKICLCLAMVFNVISWLVFKAFDVVGLIVSIFHLVVFLILQFVKQNSTE